MASVVDRASARSGGAAWAKEAMAKEGTGKSAKTEYIVTQFKKTAVCRFFPNCAMGDSCQYAHAVNELRSRPNFTKTKLCSWYAEGRCRLSSTECRFAHGVHELRPEEPSAGQARAVHSAQQQPLNARRLSSLAARMPDFNAPSSTPGSQGCSDDQYYASPTPLVDQQVPFSNMNGLHTLNMGAASVANAAAATAVPQELVDYNRFPGQSTVPGFFPSPSMLGQQMHSEPQYPASKDPLLEAQLFLALRRLHEIRMMEAAAANVAAANVAMDEFPEYVRLSSNEDPKSGLSTPSTRSGPQEYPEAQCSTPPPRFLEPQHFSSVPSSEGASEGQTSQFSVAKLLQEDPDMKFLCRMSV